MNKLLTFKYYVYTLAHPDGTVFYVGKGTGDRINDHQRNARKGIQSYTCNTIRKIWSADCKIIQTKVAFFDNEEGAYQFEINLILFFDRDNLTNLTDGGEGASKKLESDRKKRINIMLSPDTLAELEARIPEKQRSAFIENLIRHEFSMPTLPMK